MIKNSYKNIRSTIFGILIISYYILAFFVKNDNLRWVENLVLLTSVCLGIAILLLDIRRIETSKEKIYTLIILIVLAVSLQFALENYNLSLGVRLLTILFFIIVYAIFLNFNVIKVEYK